MKVIITGTTGMAGEGVLLECLANPQVTDILSVTRKPIHTKHPKLKEYIVSDFTSLKEDDESLKGYDACFFCAGISSVGMKEPEYTRITYDTTLAFAKAVSPRSQMTFAYITGAGTDSSEKVVLQRLDVHWYCGKRGLLPFLSFVCSQGSAKGTKNLINNQSF